MIPESPAAAAKLEVGDTIARAGDHDGSRDDLIAEWRSHRPGDSITIDYRRGRSNRETSTTATLTGPPGTDPAPVAQEPAPTSSTS